MPESAKDDENRGARGSGDKWIAASR